MDEHVFDVTIPSHETEEAVQKKLLKLLVEAFGEDVDVQIVDLDDDGGDTDVSGDE